MACICGGLSRTARGDPPRSSRDTSSGHLTMIQSQTPLRRYQPKVQTILDRVTVDPDARCESNAIGPGSKIEAGAVVAGDVTTGPRCIIGANVTIGDSTQMGTDVHLAAGARILANTTIGDRVAIGANAVVGTPTASSVSTSGESVVDADSVIGAGAIVAAGVRIGTRGVVSPGAVVMTDVPPKAIVAGNPARILGYVDTSTRAPLTTGLSSAQGLPSGILQKTGRPPVTWPRKLRTMQCRLPARRLLILI